MNGSQAAYQSSIASRAHASISPLRQRLIDEGVLRPDRNSERAPSPWDRLMVVQLPPSTVVLRIDDLSRARAERAARS